MATLACSPAVAKEAILAPSAFHGSAFEKPAPLSLALTPRKARGVCRASSSEDQSPAQPSRGPGRRQGLLALGASAMALALPVGPTLLIPGPAEAADIVQRAQRAAYLDKLKKSLAKAVAGDQALIPGLLRLAINDAATYDKETKTGGANGSIRFPEELERPENAGLEPALKLLEGVRAEVADGAKQGPVSYADLIQFGAAAALKRTFINYAISKAGGDEQKGIDLYRAIGSAGQWGAFDKLFGRADATEADPAGRVLDWATASPEELTAKFAPYSLKPRQVTVLAALLSDDLVGFESRLAVDPEYEKWVLKYQKSRTSVSQTDYQVDLITTLSKVSTLGAPINTEAYTFVSDRKPLRF